MSTSPAPFSINVGNLKSRSKDSSPQAVEKADTAGEKHGFVDREPKKKRGRRRTSPPLPFASSCARER